MLVVAMLSLTLALNACAGAITSSANNTGMISVVAAENFYGDIAHNWEQVTCRWSAFFRIRTLIRMNLNPVCKTAWQSARLNW